MSVITWFAQRRKALVPFVPALIIVSNYYLGVQPVASLQPGVMWSGVIAMVFTALGVHTVTNDPKPPTPPVA